MAEEYLIVHNKLHIPKKELQGRKEGRKEGEWKAWRDGWNDKQWIDGGPEVASPCGVVGIAVMLFDVCLFVGAFTVNTKKSTRKKTKNKEASRVNQHSDANPQQTL